MSKMGRFVVETHGHISTLYDSIGDDPQPQGWTGLPMAPGDGEVEHVENVGLTLWDMECYGVDMVMLYPSMTGTTNEGLLKIVDKHPDKFRAFCADQTTKLKAEREGIPWTLDAAAQEVDDALATGRYIGIGEFVPRNWDKNHIYTFEERFEEYCVFCDMARRYKVPIAYHELQWSDFYFDPWVLLNRLTRKYQDVPFIVNHGGQSIGDYPMGDWKIRKSLQSAGRYTGRNAIPNVYLEVGTWTAEMIRMACEDPNVGPTQLLWGSDYGNVPQYLYNNTNGNSKFPSTFSNSMKRWQATPAYQSDWWGWERTQIEQLKQWVGQDEINLILGGNAAKLFKLPVPYERMFMCGRPDVFGIHWKESIPYIPIEQVMYPDEKKANAKVFEERKKNPPIFHPTAKDFENKKQS